jgi:hypothetical protein
MVPPAPHHAKSGNRRHYLDLKKRSGIRRRAFGKPLSTHQNEILGSGKGRIRRVKAKAPLLLSFSSSSPASHLSPVIWFFPKLPTPPASSQTIRGSPSTRVPLLPRKTCMRPPNEATDGDVHRIWVGVAPTFEERGGIGIQWGSSGRDSGMEKLPLARSVIVILNHAEHKGLIELRRNEDGNRRR